MQKHKEPIRENGSNVIKVENLTKIFKDGKTQNKAVNNVTLEFPIGKITGLIGFNGSGKTTTYNIIANFIEKYESGEVTINGRPLTDEDRNSISYLAAGAEPQNEMRVMSHFMQIADLFFLDKKETKQKIEAMAKTLDFTQFLKKPIKTLSKGNQQKIKIIAALLNPNLKILILDEPFDGLDPIMVVRVQKLFTERKDITMLLTSHRMDVVQEMCDCFHVMKKGEIVYSRNIGDTTMMLEVNKEVDIDKLKNHKSVQKVEKFKDRWAVTIDHIDHFKELNEIIIKDPKYKYSSAVYDSLASIVFERYAA